MGWQTAADGNGRNWTWWQQELGSTCGPSCVLTLARIKGRQGNHDEASVRGLVDQANPALKDLGGRHDWTTTGAEAGALVDVLSRTFKFPKAHTADLGEERPERAKLLSLLTGKCSYEEPAIAFVSWVGGSAHWVAVCGAMEGNPNKILVLDPIAGSGLVEVSAANLPDYLSPKGGIGQFSYRVITTS